MNEEGTYDSDSAADRRLNELAKAIEEHGEVHAAFDGAFGSDVEVEMRLGTTKIDYDTDTVKVWDGDGYQTFAENKLASFYKPLTVID